MLHTKTTKRSQRKTGFSDSYHVENNDLKFAINTNAGGWDKFDANENKRFVYVLKGMGSATVKGSDEYTLEKGVHVSTKERSTLSLEGQLQYVLVEGDMFTSVEKLEKANKEYSESNSTRVVYVLEGLGTLFLDGSKEVLRDGHFVEIPKGSSFELKGSLDYLYIETN